MPDTMDKERLQTASTVCDAMQQMGPHALAVQNPGCVLTAKDYGPAPGGTHVK